MTSEAIILDTPEQINMWVLLSRRSQLKLQQKGLNVPGIVKWCRNNIPGCESARTAKQCVVPVEYAISEAGGQVDYSLVNVHIMRNVGDGIFADLGVFSDPDVALAENPEFGPMFDDGALEIVLTLDPPRERNGQFYQPA